MTLTPFRMNTYEKQGEGGPVIVNQESDEDSRSACPGRLGEEHLDEGALHYATRITAQTHIAAKASLFHQPAPILSGSRVTSHQSRGPDSAHV
jgi:hypothetical protein